MTEYAKTTVIRLSKLLHFSLSIGSLAACCSIFYKNLYTQEMGIMRFWAAMVIYTVLMLFALRAYSAYNVGLSRVRLLVYSQSVAQLVSCGILFLLLVLERFHFVTPLPMVGLLIVQLGINCLWSFLVNRLYFRLFKARRTLIVYRDESDLRRLDEIYRYDKKFRVVKTLAASGADVHPFLDEIQKYEAVFVTGVSATLRNGIAKHCVEHGIRCYITPHVGDVIMMGSKHMELFSVPVFRVMRAKPKIEYLAVKRAVDILCSLLGIVIMSPFMVVTALAIRLYDGGPAIYKQVRLTKDGKEFNILKFRSMRVNAESDGVARLATDHDDRITPVGRVIRAIRFDELPQLFNILKGDMTIVGPRPERPEIARQYQQQLPSFCLRLQVRAGLTGLAQVYGKYNTNPYEKLQMDLMYINQMSLLEDIKLIFATIKILFLKDSTSGVAEGQITAVQEEAEEKEYAMN